MKRHFFLQDDDTASLKSEVSELSHLKHKLEDQVAELEKQVEKYERDIEGFESVSVLPHYKDNMYI